ncbi:MAG: response regulator transcription factor [Bacteroidales bacterium]|nr:response regulator transcription factor [Bacteroidales bacterium]
MIKAIIVDDEVHARQAIEKILALQFRQIQVVGKAENCVEAIGMISMNEPDLIFLDINLPDGNGFDILKKIDYRKYKVIFVTAYEEYAIQAIKFSAFDYILKPVNPAEIINSVNNAIKEKITDGYDMKFQAFFDNINNSIPGVKKLVLKTSDKIHVIDIKDIIRCEADNTYTTFYLINNKSILVSKGLKNYEEMFEGKGFMRVHQSHLINLSYVSYYDKQQGGFIVMTDQSNIPVSLQKKPLLLEYLDSL